MNSKLEVIRNDFRKMVEIAEKYVDMETELEIKVDDLSEKEFRILINDPEYSDLMEREINAINVIVN